ncbi:MAG: N-acetylmuramoyl-L-alanine amidase, partial [Akkermansiaceae bacterium]
VPMRDRVAIARAATDAIVISLSCNSGAKKNRGLETHALVGIGANAAAKLTSSRSMALATVLHSRSLQYVNSKAVTGMSFDVQDRAISRAPYSILAGCQHPCAILEMGFVTNKEDAAMLNEETFRAAIARAVTRSAEVYRNVVAPKNAKPAAPAGRVGRAKGAGGVEGAFAWPK